MFGAALVGWLLLGSTSALGAAEAGAAPMDAAADSSRIMGRVLSAETGHPLPGTTVRLVELGREVLTHGNGEFHFLDVPAGEYTVLVQRLGYRPVRRSVAVAAGETVRVRIELTVSAIQMEELLVMGTVGEAARTESLRPANVVSGPELAREMDGTVAATLEDEAGIATVSMGPATARPVIRGLGGDRILMLEDGERMGDLSSASPDHAVATDPLSAKRIEVIRGPAALLYGSSALGGVVNVVREEIPTSLPDRPTGTATVQARSVSRAYAGEASAQHAFGRLAVRGEVSGRKSGDIRTPVGVLENTWTENYTLGAGASWVNGWGHAGVAARSYASTYGLPGGFMGAHEEGVRVEMERQAVKGETVLRSGFGPFSSVNLDATYTRYHHREIETGGILGTEFGLLTGTSEVLARHGELGPFAEGAVGVRGQWRDFAAGGSLGTPPAREYTASGFFLEELDFEPLRLQFGSRYDWHRVEPLETHTDVDIGEVRPRTFGSFSGSIGALYALTDHVDLGVSVARAFRTPGIEELYSEGPHLAAYSVDVGNPDLEEEIGLGWDAFLRISGERLNAEVAGFRNRIDNYIYPRNTGEVSGIRLPIYQYSNTDAVLSGFEATAEWNFLDHLVLEGAASYVRGTNTVTDEPLPLIPPFNGHVGLRYETPSLFAGARWKMAARQDRVGEFEEPTDGYHVFDADVGYRWTAFDRIHSVTLRVSNLTDAEYRNHLSRVKSVMPEPGRNISLLYRINF